MPEGPEITICKNILENKINNCFLESIDLVSGRYINTEPKNYSKFINDLPLQIKSVNNKGKFIYIILEKDWVINITFGMTGYIYDKETTHTRVSFKFKNKNKQFNLFYNDVRNFGTISFDNQMNLQKKLKQLGPDMLNDDITFDKFKDIMNKQTDKLISIVIVNQKLMSGIGNYLRSEILYDAKISPFKKVKNVTSDEMKTLLKSIKKIIKASYTAQLTNKFIGDNEYTNNFELKVYGQKKDKLGNVVKTDKLEDKRTIWYVDEVQK
jgi:DNA-formamidopyrimidine glycosylase